jgi:hypothetical protein
MLARQMIAIRRFTTILAVVMLLAFVGSAVLVNGEVIASKGPVRATPRSARSGDTRPAAIPASLTAYKSTPLPTTNNDCIGTGAYVGECEVGVIGQNIYSGIANTANRATEGCVNTVIDNAVGSSIFRKVADVGEPEVTCAVGAVTSFLHIPHIPGL